MNHKPCLNNINLSNTFFILLQVKTIKFKHPVHDIHANKNVIVISFPEKLAVFDAATIEDKFTVTTCYPCPGPRLVIVKRL